METVNELFESMDIEKEEKVALTEAFDKAVLKKTTELLDEHVETLVEEKVEVIKEEYEEKVENLTESLDGYLDTVVTDFIAENAPSYESQISEEKTKTLLEMFDNMLTVVGIDMVKIQEAKEEQIQEDYENSAEYKVTKLDEKVSDLAEKLVESKREADKYLKAGIVSETAQGLTILETAKFEKLAEMINFTRDSSYLEKLDQIKEQITSSRSEDFNAPAELPQAAFKQPTKVDSKSAMDYSKYI